MLRLPFRLTLLSVTLIAAAAAAGPLRGQVHEEAPVDLAKGLVFQTANATAGAPLGEAAQTRVAQQSFAVSALVEFSKDLSDSLLLGQVDPTQGWSLRITREGALRFEARTKDKPDPITVATPAGTIAPGTTHHIALNILRDATKPNAGLWVDGVELSSGVVPPVNLSASQPLSTNFAAKHVRLYHRDLSRAEVLALQLEAMSEGTPVAKHPVPAAGGPKFIPQPGETIALIGGTEAVHMSESGELEAWLLLAFPESRFHFRSLAWEGDTVFHQDRPLNFGDLSQQLRRVSAGTVFTMFGRQECLDRGKAGLQDFKAAFEKLLDVIQQRTPNIVVIGPQPFEVLRAPMPSFVEKNVELRAYHDAMKAASESRGLIFVPMPEVNLNDNAQDVFEHDHPLSRFQPNSSLVAYCIQMELGLSFPIPDPPKAKSDPFGPAPQRDPLFEAQDRLRPLLAAKNRLWHHYWRPSNWAFLHGDRTQQPSSRDHLNPQLRFFPTEQEKYLPLIKEAEEKVFKMVEEKAKKLP